MWDYVKDALEDIWDGLVDYVFEPIADFFLGLGIGMVKIILILLSAMGAVALGALLFGIILPDNPKWVILYMLVAVGLWKALIYPKILDL